MGAPWKVIFAFVAVFIAGAVFGGMFTARSAGKRVQAFQAQVMGRTEAAPTGNNASGRLAGKAALGGGQLVAPVMMQRLTSQLKLSEEQREKIRPIVSRTEEDLQWLRKENFRNTGRVIERMHEDVGQILTESQRAELESLRKNLQERLKRAEGERRLDGSGRGALRLAPADSRTGGKAQSTPEGEPAPKGN